jgi:hypothetical protein
LSSSRLVATALVALTSIGTLSAATPRGVTGVIATPTEILLTGDAGNEPLQIVEVRAYEFSGSAGQPRLSEVAPGRFNLRLPRWAGLHDRAYSSFMATAKSSGTQIGTNHFVDEFQGLVRNEEPFPTVASKKGLQVQMIDDALELGVKHAALNVNLTSLIGEPNHSASLGWTNRGGAIFWFHRGRIESLDRQIKRLSDNRVLVSLIILAYQSAQAEQNRLMLHPRYDTRAPNHLGAFNTETEEGVDRLAGSMEFLAERYSRVDQQLGRAVNFIIGNEINSHWFWYNMGLASMEAVADAYLRAVRICHTAVRQHSAAARVYISLEHHWNIRYPGGTDRQSFAGRPFVEYLNRAAKSQGDFDWHLAFHPYPENLFECRTWKDKTATLRFETPRITFKNLEILVSFFQREELRYRGQPRRIILSEQGFHSTQKPEGEQLQAAAYAYAYYRVAHLAGIDAFILHRHVDHPAEGGLNLGLWKRDPSGKPATRKEIYEVFRHADMPDWEQHFAFALPIIGIASWTEIKPALR